jgi:hypothetical protein
MIAGTDDMRRAIIAGRVAAYPSVFRPPECLYAIVN